MVQMKILDTITMGITKSIQLQRKRCFPLPTNNLNASSRVEAGIYGKSINES